MKEDGDKNRSKFQEVLLEDFESGVGKLDIFRNKIVCILWMTL